MIIDGISKKNTTLIYNHRQNLPSSKLDEILIVKCTIYLWRPLWKDIVLYGNEAHKVNLGFQRPQILNNTITL